MRTCFSVRVQSRSSEPGLEKVGEREYKIRVKAAPEAGRANAEVIECLASHFNVPRSCVTIVRGATSRQKIVAVETDKGKDEA